MVATSNHINGHDDSVPRDGDVPPSTLAAQLVRGHGNNVVAVVPHERPAHTFGALLQEILNNKSAPELDLDINYKLVRVVAEAGLDALVSKTSTAPCKTLICRAIDSLAVIEATCKRQPELLFYGSQSTATQVPYPHLLSWLLPKLLRSLSRSDLQALWQPSFDLLASVVTTISKTLDWWQYARIVIEIYITCVDDIMAALDNQESCLNGVVLPPIRSGSGSAPGDVVCERICLTRPSKMIATALGLCSAIKLALTDRNSLRSAHARRLSYSQWLLNAMDRLSLVLVKGQPTLSDLPLWGVLRISCIDIIREISCLVRISRYNHLVAKTAAMLLQRTTDVVKVLADSNVVTLAIEELLAVLDYDTTGKLCHELVSSKLLPTLIDSVEDLDATHPMKLAVAVLLSRCLVDVSPDKKAGAIRSVQRKCLGSPRYRQSSREIRSCIPALPYSTLVSEIASLVFQKQSNELIGISQVIVDAYPAFSHPTRSRFWTLLEALLCSSAYLSMVRNSRCPCCEKDPLKPYVKDATQSLHHIKDWPELGQIIDALLNIPAVQQSNVRRVSLAGVVRSFILHDQTGNEHHLHGFPAGEWTVKALTSSSRELRIASSRTLAAFLREDQPKNVRIENRRLAFDYLRTLSGRAALAQHETLIFAWGQVATVCGETELNLALLRLVDYLGHPNNLICALAYNEILNVSRAMNRSPEVLFRPFWQSVAVSVVRETFSVPQKIQHLADILGMSVNQFLVTTQRDTLPTMILTKQKAIVQRIVSAKGPDVELFKVCISTGPNLAAILAVLLCQPADDIEANTCAILAESVPTFAEHELSSVVRIFSPLVAAEILKNAGDESETRKPRVYMALQVLATLIDKKSSQAKSATRQSKILPLFIEAHVLGIMTHFSDVISSADDIMPRQEKVRCLRAISEMVLLAMPRMSIAIPQIRACLQAAVNQCGLLDPAMSTWLVLVRHIGEDAVMNVLDHLFAVVVQHWSQFQPETQQKIHDTVAWLLKTYNTIIREDVLYVPSLAGIPLMSKFEGELHRLKDVAAPELQVNAYVHRLENENAVVVLRAADELRQWLPANQEYVHEATLQEPPLSQISSLTRSLLDACVKYGSDSSDISIIAAQCLGLLGCQDPNRIEARVAKRQVFILSNFEKAQEVIDWVAILFEDVLVPSFKSTTSSPRSQGFLAFAMQELLRFAGFNEIASDRFDPSMSNPTYQRWFEMPEQVRNILIPFMTSHYILNSKPSSQVVESPIFNHHITYQHWLRTWVSHLLRSAVGENTKSLFRTLARVTRSHDLAIPRFLLRFAALNIILGGTAKEIDAIAREMLVVLSAEPSQEAEKTIVRQCSEAQDVFSVLDYLSLWIQDKKRSLGSDRSAARRAGQPLSEFEEAKAAGQIDSVEKVLSSIPADVTAKRAIECGSYARALFHWEQYLRSKGVHQRLTGEHNSLYDQLTLIYSKIDEPDGLDGIYAQLDILTPEQQAFQHRRAGRWSAAQSWYEFEMMKEPHNIDLQLGLLSCLKESGQYSHLFTAAIAKIPCTDANRSSLDSRLVSLAAEACWMTDQVHKIESLLPSGTEVDTSNFNLTIGMVILAIDRHENDIVENLIRQTRSSIVRSLSSANTSSLQFCHRPVLQLHTLCEIESLLKEQPAKNGLEDAARKSFAIFEKRLAILGSHVAEKQYLLGVRRAVIRSLGRPVADAACGTCWLTSARLARKGNVSSLAHFAVLQALKCGDGAAKLEEARLLWKDDQQRQAIRTLERAIASKQFSDYDMFVTAPTNPQDLQMQQNALNARAHLLLAKWQDSSGQYQMLEVRSRYQGAARMHSRWEKGHYYLGKHYNKILEAEKALPPNKRSESSMNGETVKLVIENYIRSIPFGTKYWHQTLPKLLTLWLDLGMECVSRPRDISAEIHERRLGYLNAIHLQLKKYFDRVPPYVFYTALPQMVSRISHPNRDVYIVLANIITRIVAAHPNQALWTLIPVTKATNKERASRGAKIVQDLRESKHKSRSGPDIHTMVLQAQRLQDGLLQACDVQIEGKAPVISLSKNLGFSHRLAPSPLVVPFQSALTANIPAVHDAAHIRYFKAFEQNKVTIASFGDDVLVLNSLMRPRKLTIKGSDGKLYGLLCKPKDDLRKDQRLMEFNTMINRALKRDPESGKRHLYIKTYGVTPLSEESGTIEWVEGIKPLRDILMKIYARKGLQPNYTELRGLLNEASLDPKNVHIFSKTILGVFPSVLHEWFAQGFPDPEVWFAARLRFARSAAVMSMVGHVLGLGDRHGENILLEEGSGGVFHVDFNCLFDKGLTFEKPEVVPFRLTHNMVDAMGFYGYQGPFRRSSEITLGLLRQHMDALMNILETFVHDPTTDFIGGQSKKKRNANPNVPETPQEVLDGVQGKLKGYLGGESVPLSVEGQVDALIGQATDPWNLCRLYLGWMPFW